MKYYALLIDNKQFTRTLRISKPLVVRVIRILARNQVSIAVFDSENIADQPPRSEVVDFVRTGEVKELKTKIIYTYRQI